MKHLPDYADNERRYDLLLQNSYAIELHKLYKKLFRRIGFWLGTAQIICGSVAFASLLAETINLTMIGGLVSIFALLGLMIAPEQKAAQSLFLQKQFGALYAISDSLTDIEYSKAFDLIQFEDSAVSWDWIRDIASHNNLMTNGHEKDTTPLTCWQRLLKLIFL